jgi:hypothetical protein
MINQVRDHCGNVAPPCKDCPFSLWDNHCEYTPSGLKCGECKLYKHWEKNKKNGYHLKLASSINSEDYIEKQFGSLSFSSYKNIEEYIPDFHVIMKAALKPAQYQVYISFFVNNLSNEELEAEFGPEVLNNKSPLYKKISGIKREIVKTAKREIPKLDMPE